MPRFDETGPQGFGPGTGLGIGPCGGGMGWRRGRGRGWFGRFFGQSQITEKEEADMLSGDAQDLEQELKSIRERLAQLRAKK